MDGVFMKKFVVRLGFCLILAAVFWCGTLISDAQRLREELIRLHVVANSDSLADQALKLRVRDAVTDSLRQELQNAGDAEQAKQYIQEKLPYIQQVAENTLKAMGCDETVTVRLCREAFDTRIYETFTLPAGIYNSLRIIIGQGQGQNWWCVVFPEFCIPATSEGFHHVAAGAGFPEELNGALSAEEGYELRFGILDFMGKMETLLLEG